MRTQDIIRYLRWDDEDNDILTSFGCGFFHRLGVVAPFIVLKGSQVVGGTHNTDQNDFYS